MIKSPLKDTMTMLSSKPIVSRFAPSPNGRLHLGHIASALYVWAIAGKLNAKIILRIEDHDRQRSRKPYEKAIIEDLEWLGLTAHLGINRKTFEKPSPYRQSDLNDRYQKALELLIEKDLVYGCDCSRKQIATRMKDDAHTELHYNGHCRDRGLSLSEDIGVRLKVEDQAVDFYEIGRGRVKQNPSKQCGDILLRDRHGNWTYNFAVVIDDLDQGVNLIVRGQDIQHATARQILLHKLLGNESTIAFYHHPLIKEKDGDKKLSKRDKAEAVGTLRQKGVSPEKLFGLSLFHLGISEDQESLSLSEACARITGWL